MLKHLLTVLPHRDILDFYYQLDVSSFALDKQFIYSFVFFIIFFIILNF
jgi:hypothetical protein